ncbi:hypothetical protein QO002_004524 [Pararhizobium capsulatum DSM 1112]|uniref:Uncharacterized protein n=1 Tax=Pararhizobium capsulatum DSM 1112 TaxID=1121113 RepID=A0ABU0BVP2_9HYPH|nr:hypothetical protein [Pararhizobium capsulatum DSM 1112]
MSGILGPFRQLPQSRTIKVIARCNRPTHSRPRRNPRW